MTEKLYGGFTLEQAAKRGDDCGEVARDLMAERSSHADTRRLLRIAHDALRERVSADDTKDAEWRAAVLEDLRLRAEVLSPLERKRERWCKYAAGALADSNVGVHEAAHSANGMIELESEQF